MCGKRYVKELLKSENALDASLRAWYNCIRFLRGIELVCQSRGRWPRGSVPAETLIDLLTVPPQPAAPLVSASRSDRAPGPPRSQRIRAAAFR